MKKTYQQPQVAVTMVELQASLLEASLHNVYSDREAYTRHRGGSDGDEADVIHW